MFDVITAIITNLFRTYVTKRFMCVFFEQGTVSKKRENMTYGLFYLLTTMIYLLFHYPPANVAVNILMMYIITLIYEGEQRKKILVTLLVYGINMICDVLAMYTVSNYTFGEDYNLTGAYITVLLIALSEFIIERFGIKHEKVNFAPPLWGMILIVPIISVTLLHILSVSNLNNRVVLISVSAGILIINLLIFYLYHALIDAYRKSEENTVYEMQIASYINQLDVLKLSEDKVNALRHDMKHHLAELYLMSKKYANEEIMAYIEDMQKFMVNDAEYVRSGNKEIDSILNYMLSRAEKVLDSVEYKIDIPKEIALKPFDMTVVFGNLLDNAIHAASKCAEEKWLCFSLQYEKGVLFIDIKNSYLTVHKKGDEYLSTKEGKGHGVGLQNVKKIVSSYQGTIRFIDIDDIFEVRILLYI